MRLLAAVWLFALSSMALAVEYGPGDVTVFVFDRGVPAEGLAVVLDEMELGRTDASGAVDFAVAAGAHELLLRRGTNVVATVPFSLAEGRSAEISVTLMGLGREPRLQVRQFSGGEGRATVGGTVYDPFGEPLADATVSAPAVGVEVRTAADGTFSMDLPRGEFELVVAHPDFATMNLREVRALASLGASLDLVMRPAAAAGASGVIEEVVVTGRYIPDTSMANERTAQSVLDVITAKEIAIAGDSTAAGALQRVTGVTVQRDLPVVRGLNDRFSTTLLNGAEIPSPDPSRRAIGLDIFPTDLIGGITVQKTFSPDLPADFSAGVIRLQTRGIPDETEGSISASTGYNTRSTGERGLIYQGSDTDRWGYDDGARDLPDTAARLTNNGRLPLNQLSAADNEAVAESLPNNYNIMGSELDPDFGFAGTLGGRTTLGDTPVGAILALQYDNSWRFRREDRADFTTVTSTGLFGDTSELQRTENTVATGAMLTASAELDPRNTINFLSLLSRRSLDGTYLEQGFNTSDSRDFRSVTLEWSESQLLSNQLSGRHETSWLDGVIANWQVSFSAADREEPATREYTYSKPAGSDEFFRLATGPGEAGLPPVWSWEDLDEDTLDAGFSFDIPAELFSNWSGEWKVGLSATQRDRDYEIVRWRFALAPGAGVNDPFFFETFVFPSPEMILIPERIGPNGFQLVNASTAAAGGENADNYQGTHDILAGYFMGDFYIGSDYRLQAGFRVESSDLTVTTNSLVAQGAISEGRIDETDILPAVNFTWFIDDQSQLRAALSQTLNRPQFRELSPAPYRDPETRFEAVGNPNLDQAEILNLDLRYERYWSNDEGFTVAAFYKDFTDPIEVVTIGGGSDDRGVRSFANADSATLYGLELDGRYSMASMFEATPIVSNMYLAANFAWIDSEVTVGVSDIGVATNAERRLQGQSPWVANLTLGYSNPEREIDAALLLNAFGERITEAGVNGVEDAKEQTAPQLDFNYTQALFDNWVLGLKARNLLDSRIEVEQGDFIQRSYRTGRTYSASLKYRF
ncbi:TonB-dependent receptor [Thioalkalivibrio sp. XN8]|uniref:TonB-dependent receptor n=1 Tax=Thioalkalivibrio sp. XN8 TaxID=2712863 RepID=UPI0013EBD487|nr:TonB-dependent receptor [Thioalkalivibrio sp. XN8]NGP54212.1 TonB-dependent receptor [Thioalkalivibrio sp. XN8]